MDAREEKAIWDAWGRGESRCPYCIRITCPLEWNAICDCFMAPEPPADHRCETCELP